MTAICTKDRGRKQERGRRKKYINRGRERGERVDINRERERERERKRPRRAK